MADWIRDLHAKAGKATGERIPATRGSSPHAEFIAACSPARVRVLCELAEATRQIAHYPFDVMSTAERDLRDVKDIALAAVEALEREGT